MDISLLIVIGVMVAATGLLVFINRSTVSVFRSTNLKLDAIHVLVNSNMSASMQAELDATVRELAMMHEVIDLKAASGKEPTKMALDAIKQTEGRIIELKAKINDRLYTTI